MGAALAKRMESPKGNLTVSLLENRATTKALAVPSETPIETHVQKSGPARKARQRGVRLPRRGRRLLGHSRPG